MNEVQADHFLFVQVFIDFLQFYLEEMHCEYEVESRKNCGNCRLLLLCIIIISHTSAYDLSPVSFSEFQVETHVPEEEKKSDN